jgi:hypothetical protein
VVELLEWIILVVGELVVLYKQIVFQFQDVKL